MLISLLILAAVLLSNGLPVLSSSDAASDAAGALLRPEDPSTMTLALIGAGTVAVYLASRRRVRRRAVSPLQAQLSSEMSPKITTATPASDQSEQPSRGAA
jgi:hypothetical protein